MYIKIGIKDIISPIIVKTSGKMPGVDPDLAVLDEAGQSIPFRDVSGDILKAYYIPFQGDMALVEKPFCGEDGNSIKNEGLLYNASPEGDASAVESEDAGLFVDDNRFLSEYKVSALDSDESPISLTLKESENSGFGARYILQNNAGDLILERGQVVNMGFFERMNAKNLSDKERIIRVDLASQIQDAFKAGGTGVTVSGMLDGSNIIDTKMDKDRALGARILIKVEDYATKKVEIFKPEISKDGSLSAQVKLPPASNTKIKVTVLPLITEISKGIIHKPFVNGKAGEYWKVPYDYRQALERCNLSK